MMGRREKTRMATGTDKKEKEEEDNDGYRDGLGQGQLLLS